MAVAVAVVMTARDLGGRGPDQPQPAIAGGYDIQGENACLGPKFDVKQSGQFVNLDNAKGTLGGKLEFEDGELTGDVDCVEGGEQELDARAADGAIAGTLGGEEFEALLKREVPPAGTPKPRAPDSIEAENYKITPRSPCLGSKIAIEGDGPYEVVVEGQADRRARATTKAPSPARSPARTARRGPSTATRWTARST